jgi:prepilin peptidase CpaA
MQTGLFVAAAVIFIVAAGTDLRHRRIGNELVAVLLAIAALRLCLFAGLAAALASVLVSLAVGSLLAVAYGRGWIGGGDVKLITAACLFFGAGRIPAFLLATALAGGVLSLAALGHASTRRGAAPGAAALPAATIPYGAAIAAGGLWVMLAPALRV